MRRFQWLIGAGDTIIIVLAVIVAYLTRFGFRDATLQNLAPEVSPSYLAISVGIGFLWLMLLRGFHTYRERLLGSGTDEYARVLGASFALFGGVAIASYVLKISLSRQYFLLLLPLGIAGLLLWRWMARNILLDRRAKGAYCHDALILGSSSSATSMLRELSRRPEMGLRFVAACVSDEPNSAPVEALGVPVVGGIDAAVASLRHFACDTVVITASPELTSHAIRRISWDLDPNTQVILAPSIVDVAGPRIHLRPVDGLSLVEVAMPRFDGGTLFIKRAIDVVLSVVLIVLLTPLWLVVSLLIKWEDHGPVFFRQPRVGKGGHQFAMLKFRSMRPDAEQILEKVRAERGQDAGNDVMFKMKDDPRVTRVGRVIRALSIDELPQLINVARGEMSLVGPRPPLPREVAKYEKDVQRKFLVKPGITGLWQVSGRSSLSWEESVRLDLYYVENWSLVGDLRILFRTVKAVFQRDGAY